MRFILLETVLHKISERERRQITLIMSRHIQICLRVWNIYPNLIGPPLLGPKPQVGTDVMKVCSIYILSNRPHAHWHKLHISHGYKKARTARHGRECVFLIILRRSRPRRVPSGQDPSFMCIGCVFLSRAGNSWVLMSNHGSVAANRNRLP